MVRSPAPFGDNFSIDYRESACHGPPFVNGGLGQACVTDAIGLGTTWVGGSPLQYDGLFVGSSHDGSVVPHGLKGPLSVHLAGVLHYLALGIPNTFSLEVVLLAPMVALCLAYVYACQFLDALSGHLHTGLAVEGLGCIYISHRKFVP